MKHKPQFLPPEWAQFELNKSELKGLTGFEIWRDCVLQKINADWNNLAEETIKINSFSD